ncbi:MAG: RsmB/NOP family class I SAM-dependent RNA methyltransferase [Saprospiraceae bacterium]
MTKFSEPDPNALRPLLVRAVAHALLAIFRQKQYADKVIEHTLRQSPKAGSRDRAFIAETTYDIVRYYRLYEVVLGRAPVSEQDFWKICGIHFIKLGRALPDWSEFRGLDEAEIRAEIAELQAVRKLRESVPDWLDELGAAELGDEVWAETLAQLNRPAQVVLRANTLKTNALDLKIALAAEGIEANLVEADALVLHRRQNVFQSQAFKNGLFEVQDFSSQMVAAMLAPQPGMRVVDACAGGGGKTLHLSALMQNRGGLIALDTLEWKLAELKIRARRAGATNIETRPIENRKVIKRLHGTADRLLLDVPCSGLGVLRRNPDSKWKLTPEFVENLRVTQADILQSYNPICKPGGRMVYATCSVLPSENQQQVEKFLASEAGRGFNLLEEKRILPQDRGFDGFYMALLERTA